MDGLVPHSDPRQRYVLLRGRPEVERAYLRGRLVFTERALRRVRRAPALAADFTPGLPVARSHPIVLIAEDTASGPTGCRCGRMPLEPGLTMSDGVEAGHEPAAVDPFHGDLDR